MISNAELQALVEQARGIGHTVETNCDAKARRDEGRNIIESVSINGGLALNVVTAGERLRALVAMTERGGYKASAAEYEMQTRDAARAGLADWAKAHEEATRPTYDEAPRQLAACLEYMRRVGALDSEATRAELADVLEIPASRIATFSRYGRLGVLAEGAFPAAPL
jgi:hypothetical protein